MVEASKFVTIEVESQSQTPSLRLRRRHAAWLPLSLMTFYHMYRYHYAATGDMVKFH
jgi:hypothetical protein